jgi:uncharacterized protein
VKLPDANVLIYSADQAARLHRSARGWLEEALDGQEAVCFSWLVLLAFMRVSTHPRISKTPLSVEMSSNLVESWLAQPSAIIVHPTNRHLAILRNLLAAVGTAGDLVSDAHLAALAIEHGAEVVSFDTDFARFPGLRWQMPGDARSRRNPG